MAKGDFALDESQHSGPRLLWCRIEDRERPGVAEVQHAISQLPEKDREIILMRYVEQLSNQDVARELELQEAAASMRCLRALRKLQEMLVSGSTGEADSGE